jgi:hypothetical protein
MRKWITTLALLNLAWVTRAVGQSLFHPHDFVLSWRALLIGFFIWFALIVILGAMRNSSLRESTQYVVLHGRVACPACGFMLDRDDRHCARCGDAVRQVRHRVRCTGCRAGNWDDDRFCRSCGNELASPTDYSPAAPAKPGGSESARYESDEKPTEG